MSGDSSPPMPLAFFHAAASPSASAGATNSTPISQPTMSPSGPANSSILSSLVAPRRRRKIFRLRKQSLHKAPPAKEFHYFRKLPLELRLKIWRLTLSDTTRLVGFDARDSALHLTYMSLRPLNVCQEERQELLRCFRLELNGHASIQIPRITPGDISTFNVSRDIAYFESASDLLPFWAYLCREPECLGAGDIQNIFIEEIVTPMPRLIPRSSTSQLGGLREVIRDLPFFGAVKSLTINRLCHQEKAQKAPGQKRHRAPHRLLTEEEIGTIIEHLIFRLDKPKRWHPSWKSPLVKILSHRKKLGEVKHERSTRLL